MIAYDLANWAHGLSLSQIPAEVIRQASRALLDTIGVICAGSKHEVTHTTRRGFISRQSGPSSITGGGSTTPELAALINGTAAHAYDFDDASHAGIMHGSTIIIPAILAVVEETEATDDETLEAVVIGSEIAYLLGETLGSGHYLRGWWSTSTLSVVGATVAIAKLYRLKTSQIAHAIGLAAANAGGARTVVGTDAKPFLCGFVAKTAIELATAARAGISGPLDAFESERGFFSLLNDKNWDSSQLPTLGKKWRLLNPGLLFKRYPLCSSALAATEQSVLLRAEHGFGIEEIHNIHCKVPELVRESLIYDDPQTLQQAQFSLPFCVACALHYGDIQLQHLSLSVLFDPKIRSTMSKITIAVDQALSSVTMCIEYPESTGLEIHCNDGRLFQGTTLLASGMPTRPLTDSELQDKFIACLGYVDINYENALEAARQLMPFNSSPNRRNIMKVLNSLWANHGTMI